MSDEHSLRVLLNRPIAFHRAFVPIGGIYGALMLSQAVYWSDKTSDKDGWFYKTQADWTYETGLKRSEQERARRSLKASGVLEEKRKGVPAKMYFRVNYEALLNALQGTLPAISLSDFLSYYRSALAQLSKVGLMRAKRFGAQADYVDYAEVLQQHGLTCGICGEAITRGLGQSKGFLCFDHILPISKGGGHTYANIQPAHAHCNLVKGSDDASLLSVDILECLATTNKSDYRKQTFSNTETTTETTADSWSPSQADLLGQPTQPPNGAKYSEDFLEFWKVYPRSEGKKPAYAAWKKLPPEDRKRALEDCRRRYADTEKQYVPHASTYLNQERWEDDLPPKKPDPDDPDDNMVIY